MHNGKDYKAGAISGLAGGIIFAILLGFADSFPLIARLVGSTSAGAGLIVHLVVSIIVGLTFAWWFGSVSHTYRDGVGYGLLHGLIWWVIGPVVVMPLVLGLELANPFTAGNIMSLFGHLIYGLVIGVVYVYIVVMRPHMAGHAHQA